MEAQIKHRQEEYGAFYPTNHMNILGSSHATAYRSTAKPVVSGLSIQDHLSVTAAYVAKH
jgi:hypothetical protein